jgi:hypothetical protein
VSRTRGIRASATIVAAGFVIGGAVIGGGPALADATLGAPVISEHDAASASAGVYRLPLADGAVVTVAEAPSASAVALGAEPGTDVVAAATGWIRGLHDTGAPGGDWVWIEHPNGEYTKYAGLDLAGARTNGDSVAAGDALGATAVPGLLWEVVVPAGPALRWNAADGVAANGTRAVPRVCDIADGELGPGRHVAAACRHAAPVAALDSGPYVVDEGDPLILDGSESADPDGAPLVFRWTPASLELPAEARVHVDTGDDFAGTATLTVYDQVEGLAGTVTQDIVVRNVPPSVQAVAVGADEGGVGRVRATVSDPGADAMTAQVDWGDGSRAQPVAIEQLAAGVEHGYGDDGDFPVVVTVTDDDGGVGAHAVAMRIANVAPTVELAVAGTATLPAGSFAVLAPGDTVAASARATDPGSDDLVLTWSNGLGRTFLRDGGTADAPLSPFGAVPVRAAAGTEQTYVQSGVGTLRAVMTDDDGAAADASVGVLVTGTETEVRSRSRWIHEFAGMALAEAPDATVAAYLDVVEAASTVFSEGQPVTSAAEALVVLSPRVDEPRTQARAELLCAWLQFAGGAVRWDAAITTASGNEVPLAQLLAGAERAIADPATSDGVLRGTVADLSRVSSPGE